MNKHATQRTRQLNPWDPLIGQLSHALKTLGGASRARRPTPTAATVASVTPANAGAKATNGEPTKVAESTPAAPPTAHTTSPARPSPSFHAESQGLQGLAPRTEASDSASKPLSEADRRLSASLMRVNHVGEICAQALYQAQALTARIGEQRDHLLQAAREEEDHLAWTEQRLRELHSHTSWLNPLWYAGAYGIGLLAGRLGDGISLGFVSETERQVEAHLAEHLMRLPEHDRASRAIVAQMAQDEARHGQEARDHGGQALPEPIPTLMRAAAKVMTTTAHHI
jgi:3-demethoxyubiquinol 3-hydroxylase